MLLPPRVEYVAGWAGPLRRLRGRPRAGAADRRGGGTVRLRRCGRAWCGAQVPQPAGRPRASSAPPPAARAPSGVDVVTWAPTTTGTGAARGFDQAELLAGAVATALGRPCRSLLRRMAGPAQTGRTRADRRRRPAIRGRPAGAGDGGRGRRRGHHRRDPAGGGVRPPCTRGRADVTLLALAATPGRRRVAAR